MNRPFRALVTIAAAIAAAIVVSAPSLAHSGEWGIVPEPPRSWPGAGMHIRGDLPSTGPIELVLVGSDSAAALVATIDDAPNGHFETTVTVPPALTPGVWRIEARAPGMQAASAPVELLAPPPPGSENDRGDPATSVAAAESPAAESPAAASPAAATGGTVAPAPLQAPTSGEIDLVPLVAAGLAAAVLAILLRGTGRPDTSR